MKKKLELGTNGVSLDLEQLIKTRLLVQANSGGGKSYAIRKLCEITYGGAQQIIIDVEGEFHSLRAKFDYVLAGKGGDCPADLKSAVMLARRLLELNVSAIIDIYELGVARRRFVKLFLEALVNAPKNLWHPALVIIDEAHIFCPEKDKAESAEAVASLMTLGRKRGFCGVLATQRISKLNKDAAAECNNKLIGRCGLDIDMKRAGDELGFTKREDIQALRRLAPGQFFAFGPALSEEVVATQIARVVTKHPEAGQRAIAPTPPRAQIKRVLAQLADLPHEAEEEAKTVAELKLQIKELKQAVRIVAVPQVKTVAAKEIQVAVIDAKTLARIEKVATRITKDTEKLDSVRDRLAQAQQAVVSELGNLTTLAKKNYARAGINPPVVGEMAGMNTGLTSKQARDLAQTARQLAAQRVPRIGAQQHPYPKRILEPRNPVTVMNEGPLPKGEVAVLSALIQYPEGLTGKQLSVITGYGQQSRDAYISRLTGRGLVLRDQPGHVVAIQPAANAALPDAAPLPTGEALQEYWLQKLPKGESIILKAVMAAYPEPIQGSEITEQTGYGQQSRDAYISRMASKEILERVRPGWVRASDSLFD